MKTFSAKLVATLPVAAAALLVILAGCGGSGDDDANDPGGSGQAADPVTHYFVIEEVGLGPDGYVALRNYTDVAATLGRLYLCQPPECFRLPDVEVAGGETVMVAINEDNELDGVVATWSDLALPPSDGEIGLYASEQVKDSNEIRDYLQWGSTPHDGTATAIDAGLWQESGFAPSSEDATRIFRDEGGLWIFDE